MTDTDDPTLEELMGKLRAVQLYMVRMDPVEVPDDPIAYLTPFLREHILWLRARERDGSLFLSGANRDEVGWDGSGVAILRAASRAEAELIAASEPFHREGLRKNTVHGWLLNEGQVRVSLSLFDDSFSLG
jgi:uncharacterized protein YciI